MADFDESKITRDERGRFSSGAEGFVAKHTGQLPKLEGYSKPDAGLDKWAGKVSGRQRDVEVPLASKTLGGDYASTGNLPMNEKTIETIDRFMRSRADVKKGLALIDALKTAKKSYTSTKLANDKYQKRVDAHKANIASLQSAGHGEEMATRVNALLRIREDLAKDQKKLDASTKKLAAAREAIDTAHAAEHDHQRKLENLNRTLDAIKHAFSKDGTDKNSDRTRGMSIEESKREGSWNPIKAGYNPIQLAGWKDSGATLNVQIDRKDGTIDLHLAGVSHDPKYPGEKELHLSVTPEKYASSKNAYWGETPGSKDSPQKTPREESIATQYPSDERGKAHPHEVNMESKGMGNQASFHLPDALREHVQKFRDS